MEQEIQDEEAFRDRIATIGEDGKRAWIYPKKPKGKFYNYRKWVSVILLIFLFGAPHIYIGGEQMLLFNIIERKFILFGNVFWPQDLYLFALLFITGIVFVILFTIIYGRLFCGWVCPQTIFMEMVFRRIEYWIEGDWTQQKRLNKSKWTKEKILKKTAKHIIFWLISFLIANTFLAYIIGSKALWEIQTGSLSEHFGGFISIVIFTFVFYGVFAFMREQVCTTICPYGRLQGVLLDKNSMVVAYDHKRGEERAKFRKNEVRSDVGKGDCIDCSQCVHVCPTGIDIRNGTQLECVNCTACIDACDHMMENVGLEKGLIRFVSEEGIKKGVGFQWTRRVKAYTIILIALVFVLVGLTFSRSNVDVTILRQRGTTFQMTETGEVVNIFEINLTNKTRNNYDISVKLDYPKGSVELVVDTLYLTENEHIKERFVVRMPFSELENGKLDVDLIIMNNGEEISREKIKIIGPML